MVIDLAIWSSALVKVIDVTPGSNVIVPPSHTLVSMASRRVPAPLSALLVTTTEFEHGFPTV
jgi:hypothetical protein